MVSTINCILITQIVGYSIAFLCSLCLSLPMILNQREFRDNCLLFASGLWTDSGAMMIVWDSPSRCKYTIYVGVVVAIISLIQVCRLSRFIYLKKDSDFLSAFFDVISSVVLCGMSLVAALMITFGFISWCKNITDRYDSCDISPRVPILFDERVNTSNFYIELGIAQFGAWSTMTCMVGLSVFALLKLCRQHEILNIRASLFRKQQPCHNNSDIIDENLLIKNDCETLKNEEA